MKSSSPSTGELRFTVDRSEFFAVGRALQRGFGRRLLGVVTIEIHGAKLTINSARGGSTMSCVGHGDVCVQVTANAFCELITARFRERAPSGNMVLSFRSSLKEMATDDVGVRAKFLLASS
jgi:hypothetical protein